LFRLCAVCLAVVPFLILEAVCWCWGWGDAADPADPFLEFSTNRPLFELTPDGQFWRVIPSRRRFFSDESFPAVKPPGTRRVFVVGESTVAGEPFGKPTSFPTWLQRFLQAGEDGQQWQVVNCGGVSYASYRLAPIVEECLAHQPDLMVLAVGHNEFLEERTYAPVLATPPAIRSLYDQAHRWRLFRAARQTVLAATSRPGDPSLPEVVQTRLDFENGLDDYRRDDVHRRAVIAHYEFHLRRMVRSAKQAGVPLILIRQPSNLADCPPFKCEYSPRLSGTERARCEELVAMARTAAAKDLRGAIALLESAVAIDPTHAGNQFDLGKCCEALGDWPGARAAFLAARDNDICPLRTVSEMEQILSRIAAETRTPLIDAHALLEQQTTSGILGGFLLVDHVHPSIAGHQLIARRLTEELESLGLYEPTVECGPAYDAACAAHLAALDPQYFLRGRRTLRSLQAWAAGRAARTPTVSTLDDVGGDAR
jgi:lysophospholipase L1-like esterase